MLMLVLLCGLAYIELRRNFRSKFILRLFTFQIYFASFYVPNLFCFGAIGVHVILILSFNRGN
jgi:hypothetical protein